MTGYVKQFLGSFALAGVLMLVAEYRRQQRVRELHRHDVDYTRKTGLKLILGAGGDAA